MWWVTGLVVAAVLLSAYLTWTARRVDRLHTRVESAARALDAHLLRRAAAAAVTAERYGLLELYAAARIALDAAPAEREAAESDLTRQLSAVELVDSDPVSHTLLASSRRVALARQVHTDLVRDALTARRRPLVRLLRMDRRHRCPAYFDMVEPALPGSPLVPTPTGVATADRAPDVILDRR